MGPLREAGLTMSYAEMGYHLENEQLDEVFRQFKELADKKKEIYDGDIAALIEQQIHTGSERWSLVSYHLVTGSDETPEVTLNLAHGSEQFSTTMSVGDGPIDAIFLAVEAMTGYTVVCKDFNVHSVTVGKDAQGEVMVQVEYQGRLYRGRGISTDSVEASVKAFLNAINRIAASVTEGSG